MSNSRVGVPCNDPVTGRIPVGKTSMRPRACSYRAVRAEPSSLREQTCAGAGRRTFCGQTLHGCGTLEFHHGHSDVSRADCRCRGGSCRTEIQDGLRAREAAETEIARSEAAAQRGEEERQACRQGVARRAQGCREGSTRLQEGDRSRHQGRIQSCEGCTGERNHRDAKKSLVADGRDVASSASPHAARPTHAPRRIRSR